MRSVFYVFYWKWGGGGVVMDLVYGSSPSSYMDCKVFFGDECFHFRRSGVRLDQCSCVSAFVVGLIIFGSYFCGGLPARLLWTSLRPRVCESSSLSNWSFPFGGPSSISHLFLSWRPRRSQSLIPSLGPSFGVLVRLCGGPCWRSLAMSWACPPPFLCVSLVGRSRRIVAPLAQCLCWRLLSFVSGSSCGGASPRALGSVGALGV